MLETIVTIALVSVACSMALLSFRVIKGPSTPDRVVALDAIGINLVAIIALISIVLKTSVFLDIALLIGILAFIGTVAFAKYLEKGVIVEMTEIIKFIIILFIIIGAFLNLAAAFGVLRLPDVYTRNHAASKATTIGVVVLLLATFLYFYIELEKVEPKLILTIVFIFLTSPVSGHLINRAAYNSGVKLWNKSVRDDLKLLEQRK